MRLFHSIRAKVTLLALCAILAVATLTGIVSEWKLIELSESYEIQNITRTTRSQAEATNLVLSQAENVARYVSGGVVQGISSPEELRDPAVRKILSRNVEIAFQSSVDNLGSVCAYYLIYARNLDGASENVLFLRDADGDGFHDGHEESRAAKLLANPEQARWYREALSTGAPAWLLPQYSEILGRNVISYLIPVYKDKAFVAMVGVDIDFDRMLAETAALRLYRTGRVLLVDRTGTIAYTEAYPLGTMITALGYHPVEEMDRIGDESFFHYEDGGDLYDASLADLVNGMAIVGIVPVREAFEKPYRAAIELFVINACLCILFAFFAHSVADRIVRRLGYVAGAAARAAESGDLAPLEALGKDEIGEFGRKIGASVGKLRESAERAAYLSRHDALTKILNRKGIDDAIDRALAAHPMQQAAAVSLDIDDFKFVNDLYGHAAGDEALRVLAQDLQACFGAPHIVGRNGGDEFVAFLCHVDDGEAESLVRRLSAMPHTFCAGDAMRSFTISIGCARYEAGMAKEELLHRADLALYAVKMKGKNGYCFYAPEMERLERKTLGFNLEDIAANVPTGILVFAADGAREILFANRALIEMAGCERREDFMAFTGGALAGLVEGDAASLFGSPEAGERGVRAFRMKRRGIEPLAVCAATHFSRNPNHGAIFYLSIVSERVAADVMADSALPGAP